MSVVASSTQQPIVIFDFDGTIADSLDLVIQQYNRLAPRFRAKLVDRSELPRLRKLKAAAAMREHNISFWKVPLLVSAMRSAMQSHVEGVQPCAGVLDAIRDLHRAGVRCSVLSTNSNRNITGFLERNDLRVFEHIAGGASMFGKARALRKLIKLAGYRVDEVAYVGDEARDVEAAQAVGVRSIAVSWGYADRGTLSELRPTRLVDTPSELLSAVTESARLA